MYRVHNATKNAMTQLISNGVNGHHDDYDRLTLNGHGTNGLSNGLSNGTTTNGETNGKVIQRKRLDRKKSSPMMPAFMVSAPGKVIVFGEHAVVHGKVGCWFCLDP